MQKISLHRAIRFAFSLVSSLFTFFVLFIPLYQRGDNYRWGSYLSGTVENGFHLLDFWARFTDRSVCAIIAGIIVNVQLFYSLLAVGESVRIFLFKEEEEAKKATDCLMWLNWTACALYSAVCVMMFIEGLATMGGDLYCYGYLAILIACFIIYSYLGFVKKIQEK